MTLKKKKKSVQHHSKQNVTKEQKGEYNPICGYSIIMNNIVHYIL